MILLPDMHFNIDGRDCTLSLQDPYTLNGKLITSISIDRDNDYAYATDCYGTRIARINTSYYNQIIIRNENDFYISIPSQTLANGIREKLDLFFHENSYSVLVGEGRYRWRIRQGYNVDDYISDLSEQVRKLYNSLTLSYADSISDYVSVCRSRLRDQGRSATTSTNNPYRSYSHAEGYVTSATTNSGLANFGCTVEELSSTLNTLSSSLYPGETKEYKYIHNYNYKPEYIKHYMSDEDNSSLLLGAEIEVDCGGKSEEHAKKVLRIMCGINPEDTEKVLEDKMYCTSDGSLTNGIEFDTMPCTLEYHKNEMKYKEMFNYLDKNGYKAHDTTTCGLHIHANREYLGKSELMQQLTISKILYILEKFNDEICVIARRDNRYSSFVGEGKNEKTVVELYKKYKDKGKHVALNLSHKETIEFRCFKGTLKYETFILTLEFVKNIIDYAKSINIEDIELIKWSDLMDVFSEELKEYYNDRLEKEKSKKDSSEEKKISLESGNLYFSNANGESIDVGSAIGTFSIDTAVNSSNLSNITLDPSTITISNINSNDYDTTSFVDEIRSINPIAHREEDTDRSRRRGWFY